MIPVYHLWSKHSKMAKRQRCLVGKLAKTKKVLVGKSNCQGVEHGSVAETL